MNGAKPGPRTEQRPLTNNDPFKNLDVTDDPMADLDRATQQLALRTDERRYGKRMVIIEGFDDTTDVEALASELKSMLGTGGTVKDGRIEIQGDHEARIRELLEERGYRIMD